MRICQVQTGMIPIKPIGQMGWGAVEKIIREYQICLESMGHQVDIKYLNEIEPGQYDFVHVHMGNLALECDRKGIPFVFSLHDHHTELLLQAQFRRDEEVNFLYHSRRASIRLL